MSDPLALHHIVVKDQYVYEETDMFTTWANVFESSSTSLNALLPGRTKSYSVSVSSLQEVCLKRPFQHLRNFTDALFCEGEQHRKQRKMLNPVFSQKHIRGLLPIFQPIANEVNQHS